MDPKLKARIEKLEQLTERTQSYDQQIRSQIIYFTILLENEIEQIIAWHFCPDQAKHDLFISLVFNDGEVTLNLLRNKGTQGKVCHEKINYEPLQQTRS